MWTYTSLTVGLLSLDRFEPRTSNSYPPSAGMSKGPSPNGHYPGNRHAATSRPGPAPFSGPRGRAGFILKARGSRTGGAHVREERGSRAGAEPIAGRARTDARPAGAGAGGDEAHAHPGAAARDHRGGGSALRGLGPGDARRRPAKGAGAPARARARVATGRGPPGEPAEDRGRALRGAGAPPRPGTSGRPRRALAPDGTARRHLRGDRRRVARTEEAVDLGGDELSARPGRRALQADRAPPYPDAPILRTTYLPSRCPETGRTRSLPPSRERGGHREHARRPPN